MSEGPFERFLANALTLLVGIIQIGARIRTVFRALVHLGERRVKVFFMLPHALLSRRMQVDPLY